MLDYNGFINKFSTNMKGSLTQEEFIILKNYVSNQIFSLIDYNELNFDNISDLIDNSLMFLLKNMTYQEIMNGNSDDILEKFVIGEYNNSKNKRLNSSYTPLKLIKSIVYRIKDIFNQEVNLDILSSELYEMLLIKGYTDADILNGNFEDEFLDYICSNMNGFLFNTTFEEFRLNIEKKVSAIIEIKKEFSNIDEDQDNTNINKLCNCYNDPVFIRRTAFKAALYYFIDKNMKYDILDSELSSYIEGTINKEKIKFNSITFKDNTNLFETYVVKEKSDIKSVVKEKITRVFASIFVLLSIKNTIYSTATKIKEYEIKSVKDEFGYTGFNDNVHDIINIDYNNLSDGDDSNVKL